MARLCSTIELSMISVVINTLNEEDNIANCIDSVKDFADEVIVVDMHSEDKTQEIAEKMGAKVFKHERTGYVEPARNFAIEKAKGEWILILDADEQLTDDLGEKLESIVKLDKYDYVAIPRKNIVFGKWIQYSRWWPDYNIRFFKKGKVAWHKEIHSVPMTNGKGTDLEAVESLAIVHHHYVSIDQYIERMNRYTSKQADARKEAGEIFKWKDILIKPGGEFLSRFFAGKGYKDGLHGLALSSLQAFSELVVYLKLWQMEKFTPKQLDYREVIEAMKKIHKEENYWYADTYVNEHGGFTNKVKRKLKLS